METFYCSSKVSGLNLPVLTNKDLTISVIGHNLTNTKEFLPIGEDIFLLSQNNDKVSLITPESLKKYSVLDVDPSTNGRLLGISYIPTEKGNEVFIEYLQPEERNPKNSPANMIVFSYIWNKTTLELTSPKRIAEMSLTNSNIDMIGTMVSDGRGSLVLTGGFNQSLRSNEPNLASNQKNCTNGLVRFDVASSVLFAPSSSSNNFFWYCTIGQLHSLVFDPIISAVFGIERVVENDKLITINTESNKSTSYSLCLPISIVQHNASSLEKQRGDRNCPFNSAGSKVSSVAIANSQILGQKYFGHLFIADQNGSIYHFSPDSQLTSIKGKIPMQLFASGFGNISEIQIGLKGLYILSTPSGDEPVGIHEMSIYIISPRPILAPSHVITYYDNLALISTAGLISIIIGISVVYYRKEHKKRKSEENAL